MKDSTKSRARLMRHGTVVFSLIRGVAVAWILLTVGAVVESPTAAGALPVVPVRFVVLSDRKEVARRATPAQMHEEVRIMNRFFVTEDRRALYEFRFHSLQRYEELSDSPCEVVALSRKQVDTRSFISRVTACPDPRVFLPTALNVYIIDTYDSKRGYEEEDSYGGGSGPRRFVALDYTRLGHVRAAEEHELGHAFGLGHVCHPGADRNTKTNVMAQREACPGGRGHEGDRSIGFNRSQEAAIRKKGAAMLAYMKSPYVAGEIRNPGFEETHRWEWSRGAYTINHRSGKYALNVAEGREIHQEVFLAENGAYLLRFYHNSHGPGGTAAVDVNGVQVGRLELGAAGGYGKPFVEASLGFVVSRPSVVRVRFSAPVKLWVDDVSLERQ